ncbi:5-(carboxyamino)imidazole ribonucleotide synthase [Rhodobacteraceae bacterium 2376]|uniref:N5-carboxyaminoimidazole ribonucleotide synthase n=1 Tax=Rhabdonatronobacter sediminivivens TaxID=2743469 RepID=A0A7Z0KYR5_9RHOB|nr:5-(carboxyamino)imidazole ribonucleotide synthase [Rhabdonatronobacter sediminivivens]NYS25609.1 5-(carboxyamino)imidazole ribonucleotide synthase [Rhabdonatronobacter sediminivivens]
MTDPLGPGAVIGILGGGQLGRMLAVAAGRLGLRAHVYDPAPAPPAGDLCHALTTAAWEDHDALRRFAGAVDVITYEFENIPAATLDLLESLRPVRPGRRALEVSQDRLTEKRFLQDLGLATAPFAPIDSMDDLEAALARIGTPAILKTRRLGYDGKGQARISAAADAPVALQAMAGAPAILEGFVRFEREISVIAARGLAGAVQAYDPGENLHEGGILRRTTLPAAISPATRTEAALLAGRILTALDYVGVMGVELFVTPAGPVVNEIAPRVHNSGHWTQQGCTVDQFEQHIRAVAGWPLGDPRRHADVEMENLIGDDMDRVAQIITEPGAALHLYGKTETRPGRKMGHVNRIRT